MVMSNEDLEWYERAKQDFDHAGFAVTCKNCSKSLRDIDAPEANDPTIFCYCDDPIDYNEVAQAHGLGLFASMFTMKTLNGDDLEKIRETA